MHACLNKADEQLYVLNDQLLRTSGEAKNIIINELSGNYIVRVHRLLEDFNADFENISKIIMILKKK